MLFQKGFNELKITNQTVNSLCYHDMVRSQGTEEVSLENLLPLNSSSATYTDDQIGLFTCEIDTFAKTLSLN